MPVYLRLDDAMNLMHRKDARMVRMNTKDGPQWFVVIAGARSRSTSRTMQRCGGRIKDDHAKKILERPDIHGAEDCLFPGLRQTYRMVRG
jgi:hypothetical protein